MQQQTLELNSFFKDNQQLGKIINENEATQSQELRLYKQLVCRMKDEQKLKILSKEIEARKKPNFSPLQKMKFNMNRKFNDLTQQLTLSEQVLTQALHNRKRNFSHVLDVKKEELNCFEVDPEGKYLVLCFFEGLKLYRLAEKKYIDVDFKGECNGVVWVDGRCIIASDGQFFELLDSGKMEKVSELVESGEGDQSVIKKYTAFKEVFGLSSHQGMVVFSDTYSGKTYMIDPKTFKNPRIIAGYYQDTKSRINLDPRSPTFRKNTLFVADPTFEHVVEWKSYNRVKCLIHFSKQQANLTKISPSCVKYCERNDRLYICGPESNLLFSYQFGKSYKQFQNHFEGLLKKPEWLSVHNPSGTVFVFEREANKISSFKVY